MLNLWLSKEKSPGSHHLPFHLVSILAPCQFQDVSKCRHGKGCPPWTLWVWMGSTTPVLVTRDVLLNLRPFYN